MDDYNWVIAKRTCTDLRCHSTGTRGSWYMCQCVWLCFCLKMMWWVFFLYPQLCLLKTIETQGFVWNWLPVLSIWGLSFIHGTLRGLAFPITSVKISPLVCDYKYSWKVTQITFISTSFCLRKWQGAVFQKAVSVQLLCYINLVAQAVSLT